MGTRPAPSARVDGNALIADYGAIGDGRTTALVARDGSVDWLCLPDQDAGSVFGALLDPERGGAFTLAPVDPGSASRQRYLEGSNVLETTFHTADGVVRVTDAITTDGGRILPWNELVRRVECRAGSASMRWRVTPRFDYGRAEPPAIERVGDHVHVAESEAGMLGILTWNAGSPDCSRGGVGAEFELDAGDSATLALVFAADEPLAIPRRDELEDRLDRTTAAWREWLGAHDYRGAWRAEVERSLLALQLLTSPTTGAVVAAPTTSLPERIGGDRNYDYRHAWPRDTAFTLDALLHCELREPAHRSFVWLLDALAGTHPRVQPIYDLHGDVLDEESELPLRGYRRSRPVRDGNSAAHQLQLGAYGELMHTAWLYTRLGNRLDRATGERLADIADHLCSIWGNADSSIWELPHPRHYTVSKMGSWLCLQRALQLADAGEVPTGGVERWRRERNAIAAWIERRCWSPDRGAYTMYPDGDALDVATLLMGRIGYDEIAGDRFGATIDTVRDELTDGPCTHRYSGMEGEEGAFVACSFWIAEALARVGRTDEASALMEGALGLGNDLGLFAEEVDPAGGELLGNFPQGLSHLSLINAAATIDRSA
jgi:GH15 family glucan-1,4-alpha-glucosidase